jgi:hypothetical protein
MISTYTYFGQPVQITGATVKFTGSFKNVEQPRKYPPFPHNCDSECYEDSYFMMNHLNFKVISIDRFSCNVLLLDTHTDRLYWSNNPVHIHNIELIDYSDDINENGEYFDGFHIFDTDKEATCLGVNKGTHCKRNACENGFCGLRSCQLQKDKFQVMDFSKLLTYRQFLGLCDAKFDQFYNGFKWCKVCGFTTCPDATYQTIGSLHDNEWDDDEYDLHYHPCKTMCDTQFKKKSEKFYEMCDEHSYFEFKTIFEPISCSFTDQEEKRFLALATFYTSVTNNLLCNKSTRIDNLIEFFTLLRNPICIAFMSKSIKFKETLFKKIVEFSNYSGELKTMREIEKFRILNKSIVKLKNYIGV